MNISEWLSQINKKIIVIFTLSYFLLFIFSSLAFEYSQREKNEQYINRLTLILSQTIQQKNRNLIETLIIGSYHDLRVKSVALCDENIPLISFPSQTTKTCTIGANYKILGSDNLRFSFILQNPINYSFVIVALFFYFLILVFVWVFSKNISKQIRTELISPLEQGLELPPNSSIQEISKLIAKLQDWSNLKVETEKNKALTKLATQVAHDLRSPLSVLKSQLQPLNNDNKLLADSISRIDSIASDLLTERKRITLTDNSLEQLSSEKLVTYPDKKIELSCIDSSKINNYIVKHIDLTRILSNLLNNAIESADHPQIEISSKETECNFQIIIKDNGAGIPKKVLEKLGKESITTKPEGNGLGLLGAFQKMKEWGGELKIESEPNKGTTITLVFPLERSNNSPIILVDDDALVRLNWESRAKKAKIHFKAYSRGEELLPILETLPLETNFYLDMEIKNSALSGIELAKILKEKGFNNLYLASGHEHIESDLFIGQQSKTCPF